MGILKENIIFEKLKKYIDNKTNKENQKRKEMDMYLIVGLGNPGEKYNKTRHNMGFDVIDKINEKVKGKYITKYEAKYVKTKIKDKEVILLKPETFMNLSGKAILNFMKFFKIGQDKIIIIYDDKDTKPGDIRIRKTGSSGGHNGIKSILQVTDKFVRVRVGIGMPQFKDDMINHVIAKVSNGEYEKLYEGVKKAEKAVYDILEYGTDIAMNKNNGSGQTQEKSKNKEKNKLKGKIGGNKMEKIYISGHQNPDTDTIMSALAAEYLFTKLGYNVEAVKQGILNPETEFVIEKTGLRVPETKTELPEKTGVILVDHNNPMESFANIDELIVKNVIDHHAVKMNVGYPLYFRAEPVGCAATIIFKMYRENGVEIPKQIALAMLSAIISDTLLFKSPTCTPEDVMVAEELEKIAEVNKEEYGMEMLKAGTDLSKYTVSEILNLDAKTAMFGEFKATVAQVMTADVEETLKMEEELKKGINAEIEENNLDLFMLLITDIVNSDSTVIALGNRQDAVEKGYNVKLENDKAVLKGVVSRKKQVIPVITENLK